MMISPFMYLDMLGDLMLILKRRIGERIRLVIEVSGSVWWLTYDGFRGTTRLFSLYPDAPDSIAGLMVFSFSEDELKSDPKTFVWEEGPLGMKCKSKLVLTCISGLRTVKLGLVHTEGLELKREEIINSK